MNADLHQLQKDCELVVTMMFNGHRVQAQRKINELCAANPTLAHDIKITVVNMTTDRITGSSTTT